MCFTTACSRCIEGGFDAFAEASCALLRRPGWARPRCRPGARMHLVGSLRGHRLNAVMDRCSDSLSPSSCDWASRQRVPDHSWLAKTRARLPHEVHAASSTGVLALIGDPAGLVNASASGSAMPRRPWRPTRRLRNIVRRDTGEGRTGDAGAPGPGARHRWTPTAECFVWTALYKNVCCVICTARLWLR